MPTVQPPAMPTASTRPQPQQPAYEPRRMPWNDDKVPMRNIDDFIEVHRYADEKIRSYVDKERSDYQKLTTAAEAELAASEIYLYSNNADSRIKFAEIVLRHVLGNQEVTAGSFFTVGLSPSRYALPIAAASEINLRSIQRTAQQALQGIAFIGMVEAGLYCKWGPNGPCNDYYVSWHVHLIVWGCPVDKIRAALQLSMKKHVNIKGGTAYHVGTPLSGELEAKLLYALKGQLKEYYVNAVPDAYEVDEDGVLTPRRLNQPRGIQPGNRIRMCNVMAGQTLDKLIFGNKGGTAIVAAIKKEALGPYRREERQIQENRRAAAHIARYGFLQR